MGDKTQVFPLESIESIRTRLTHSYEVANLARSLGLEIAVKLADRLPDDAARTIPAMLAAVGLAHDIGNPPFGHQGENAIRSWFRRNAERLFEYGGDDALISQDIRKLSDQHRQDFLRFEGNAQTLRVLTKLQVIGDDLGLNLTVGTLAALMKYVSASHALDKEVAARKKVGFFATEQTLVERVRREVGLSGDSRHPLALVMEACDDIAYSVLDAEDSIKKGLVSFNDLIAWLRHHPSCAEYNDDVITYVCNRAHKDYLDLIQTNLHPIELNDVATQKFRVFAIHIMISAVADAFIRNHDPIVSGNFSGDLIGASRAANLCAALKQFDRENAFSHRSVLEVELNGFNVLNRLMDFLWIGITERKEYLDLASSRTNPFSAYVYSRISRNYRRVFEGSVTRYHPDETFPVRYREMQLLTDMVSGMTDRFCIDLHNDFAGHCRDVSR
jgi:dGTPase